MKNKVPSRKVNRFIRSAIQEKIRFIFLENPFNKKETRIVLNEEVEE